MANYGPINLPWKNLFDFEQSDQNIPIQRLPRVRYLD